jgi:ankyrin repeat protein
MKVSFHMGSMVALSLLLVAATPPDSPVADAAERGDLEVVRALLRDGADANGAQADGTTALHWAAMNDDVQIVEVLLYAGATVKPTTRLGGYTPLHLASRNGHAHVVSALLEGGADANDFTNTGVSALHFAAQANSAEAVRALVEHGADVDSRDTHSSRTPLMFAAVGNSAAAMQALIDAGADMSAATDIKDYEQISDANSKDRARRTAVRNAGLPPDQRPAARRGGGAPPQSAQTAARRPGQPAATTPDADTKPDPAETADPDEKPEADAAADPGEGPHADEPAEKPHVDEPADSDTTKPEEPGEPPIKALSSTQQLGKQGGFTALHYAVREGHRDAARLLIAAGADIDQVTEGDESSPLLVAVINGHYDLATELVEHGADPNLVSDDGAGPLFATLNIEWSLRTWYPQPGAFRRQATSYLDLTRSLLEAGADPNERTTTHIWYASYNAGRMGVDFTGATPFWRAAYAADVSAMKLLVAHGADPDIWTIKLPARRRFNRDPDIPNNPVNDEPEPVDPSGLPPIPVGGHGIHPMHAAAGVGFGTSRVAQQHRSVPDGWLPSMKYFIEELGVDPNLRDQDGFTVLHHSAARGDSETVLYLVSQGADVTLISRRGQTTADMANSPEQRAQPHPVTVALLEKLGSKNNHQCKSCGEGRGN